MLTSTTAILLHPNRTGEHRAEVTLCPGWNGSALSRAAGATFATEVLVRIRAQVTNEAPVRAYDVRGNLSPELGKDSDPKADEAVNLFLQFEEMETESGPGTVRLGVRCSERIPGAATLYAEIRRGMSVSRLTELEMAVDPPTMYSASRVKPVEFAKGETTETAHLDAMAAHMVVLLVGKYGFSRG